MSTSNVDRWFAWRRAGMICAGALTALVGLAQLSEGEAEGDYGFGASRQNEPVLFWIYIGAHFVIASWIIIVALLSKPRRDEKGA